MRATRASVLVALATAVAGCATTGTPPPGGFVTKCKEIDLSKYSLEPTPLEVFEKEQKTIAPGFLRIQYSWEDPNAGPVYAVGILYENIDTQTLAFIVGPLGGFPMDWKGDATKADIPRKAKDDWVRFFTKLRKVTQEVRPGGVFCAGGACGMPPDSPPPELLGTASSGSSGGYGALFSGTPEQMYAQATRASNVMSDAGFSKTRAERERIIKDLARKTCHGVQAHLGYE